MSDLIVPGLVAFGVAAGTKLIDNLLERRKAARTATREDRHDALAEVEKLWARIDKMESDHANELAEIKAEYVQRITAVTLERDALLREIGPLKIEVEHLRQRVKQLEGANGHG